MIPIIITIDDKDNRETIVSHFADEYDIESSHRMVILPEKEELTVDQIHLMQRDIQVSFSKRVLVVLQGVDNSSNEVQNSLLKCLEEESGRIQFLFLIKNPARLLPTILSRCSTIENYLPQSREQKAIGSYLDFFSFQNNSDAPKEEAVRRIDDFLQSSSVKNHQILRHLLQIRKYILDNNMNPAFALDSILIYLSKNSTINTIHEK